MKGKVRSVIRMSLLPVLCLFISGFIFSGCTNEDEPNVYIYDRDMVTGYFGQIFCRDGKLTGVIQDEYDPSTRTVGVEERDMPCRIFKAITGVEIESGETYHGYFQTNDRECSLNISGTLHPENGVYAVLQVDIPAYQQVKQIRMVDVELLNNKNEVVTDATTGQQYK